MPNLIDLVEMAEALESKAVFLAADRCVAVRNRHASCRKCSDACPVDAVHAKNNILTLNNELCVACGACTTVCPTEALIPLKPLDEDLAAAARSSAKPSQSRAVFACARMVSKRIGDPTKFAEVPCLARMEESLLLQLAAQGFSDILLVDATCSTCKFRATIPGIDTTVTSANQLIAAQGAKARVQRSSAFPDDLLLEDQRTLLAASRRGFFTQARSVAKDAAGKTVEVALKKTSNEAIKTLRDRLRLSEAGTLPQFNPVRRMRALDAMDQLGSSVVPTVDTRLFGRVEIDQNECSSCGMCTVFCPTGALAKSDIVPQDAEGSYLEFSASDCVQCHLCADACLKKCLTVKSEVPTEELFDFEPRLIFLPKPPARPGVLSSLKR